MAKKSGENQIKFYSNILAQSIIDDIRSQSHQDSISNIIQFCHLGANLMYQVGILYL